MARVTSEQLQAAGAVPNANPDPSDLLGVLVSGKNPDGTPFKLPVETGDGGAKGAVVNATLDGENELIAAVAGKKLRVVGYQISATGAGTLIVRDGASNAERARIRVGVDGGGASYAGDYDAFAFETAVGQALELVNPAGIDSFGHLTYFEV